MVPGGESELVRVGAASSVALSGARRSSQDMGERGRSGRRLGLDARLRFARGRSALRPRASWPGALVRGRIGGGE